MLLRASTIVFVAMVTSCLLPAAFCQEPDRAQKAKAEYLVYASLVNAAHQACQQGDDKDVREKLALTNPKLRGWEHDYLLNQSMQIGKEGHRTKRVLEGSESWIDSVAFTPDGRRLVVGSNNNVVKVWDFIRDESMDLKGHEAAVVAVAASPDGKKFASGGWDGKVFIWDAAAGKKLVEYRGHNLPNTPPGDSQTTTLRSVCFSPDSKRVVSVAFGNSPFVRHLNCEVKIWSAETGKTLITLEGQHTKSRNFFIYNASYSPNGKLIATGGYDHKLKLWDATTGKVHRVIEGHTNNVLGVAFSPDGKRVATASTDRTLAVWDVSTGEELFRLKGHRGPVFSVMYSRDGKRIVSGCWDKTVKLWNADTGVELLTLGNLPGPIRTVVFSLDGKRIAAAGGAPKRIANATVWDSTSFELKK